MSRIHELQNSPIISSILERSNNFSKQVNNLLAKVAIAALTALAVFVTYFILFAKTATGQKPLKVQLNSLSDEQREAAAVKKAQSVVLLQGFLRTKMAQARLQKQQEAAKPKYPQPIPPPNDLLKGVDLNELSEQERAQLFCKLFSVRDCIELTTTRMNLQYCLGNRSKAIFICPKSPIAAQDSANFTFFAMRPERIFRLLKKAQFYDVEVILVNTIDDINQALNHNHSIDYLELGGHGSSTTLKIGHSDGKAIQITTDNVNQLKLDRMALNSTIFLVACSVGKSDDSLTRALSRVAGQGVCVYGATEAISESDVRRVRNDEAEGGGGSYITIATNPKTGQNITRVYINGKEQKKIDLNVILTLSNYKTLGFMKEKVLRKRYFCWLKKMGYYTKNWTDITRSDWQRHGGGSNMVIFHENRHCSRMNILRDTLKPFYDAQHLAYEVTTTGAFDSMLGNKSRAFRSGDRHYYM